MQGREPKRLDDVDALGWPDDSFSRDLGHAPGDDVTQPGAGSGETRQLGRHETLPESLGELSSDERERIVVVDEGADLEQGSVYVDLDDLDAGPFAALGGQVAGPGNRYVPKRALDYELWNRLVGRDADTDVVRPPARSDTEA